MKFRSSLRMWLTLRKLGRFEKRLIFGAAFAIPVFILGMLERAPIAQFVLTLPVLVYAGRGFFHDAWTAALHRSANMNTLIALGTGAAFVYSTWVIATEGGNEVYFEAAAVITVLILLGRGVEMRATGKGLRGYSPSDEAAALSSAGESSGAVKSRRFRWLKFAWETPL